MSGSRTLAHAFKDGGIKEELLRALELDRAGDWDAAHGIVQEIESVYSYLVHAYLHRKEGDLGNAAYWYRRAGRPTPESTIALDREWNEIRQELDQLED